MRPAWMEKDVLIGTLRPWMAPRLNHPEPAQWFRHRRAQSGCGACAAHLRGL